ncbi:MAG: thiamine phosphate synthase [Gaiellales bacterium]
MSLDRFYPVVENAAWIERLLPLGVKMVQLRIKDVPPVRLRIEITRARDLCRDYGATLVVNDYWQLAIELGCDWVHLGQEDLDDADISAIRHAGIRLGISTHDRGELDRALLFDPDYVALGPIYPTILKAMRWREQGLQRITEWKEAIKAIPLVAIGGMSVERAAGALAAGADIVSAVTDITLRDDPESRVRDWIKATR